MRQIILLIFLFSFQAISGQIHVSGRIYDRESGKPIPYALINSGIQRTYSDQEGKFSLMADMADSVIRVTASFYQPLEITFSPEQVLEIGLLPEEQNIEAVTVSALRIESRLLNSTAAVSLVTESQIARNSAIAIEPSLNQVPGIFMHSGSLNTNRITIRGIGSRTTYGTGKIKAYLDEIPLTSGDGETTLEDISLPAISQVEVVRGPSSGVHGSGLGGAILLRSNTGSEGFKAQTTFMSGSFGTHREGITVTSNRERSSHLLITDFLYSDGYRENNRYNRSNLFSYNRFELGESSRLSVLFDFVDLVAFIPSSIDYQTYMTNPQKAAANWAGIKGNEDVRKIRGGATLYHSLSEGSGISVTGYLSHTMNLELRPFNLLNEETFSAGGRFSWKYKTAGFELNAGNEFLREAYDWSTYRNVEVKPENMIGDHTEIRFWNNLFLLARWNPIPALAVEPGVNLNYTRYDYTDRYTEDGDASGSRKFPLLLSPRLAANIQTSDRQAIYAVVSHGFSSPTLQETLMPDGQVNPDIEPETGWNFEAGLRGKLFSNRLFYDVTAYRMMVRNLLVARRTGEDAFVGVNAGRTSHSGLEFDLRYFGSFRRKIHYNFFGNGTIARYRFEKFTDLDNVYSGNDLTGFPGIILNGGMEFRTLKGWNVFLSWRHSGQIPLNDANSIYSDPYNILNGKAGKNFRFLELAWKISGGINNMLDTRYASMFLINAPSFGSNQPRYYYPGLPRNYFVTLQITYINN